jgi:ATP-dependent DNA helicase RecG
MKILRKTDEGFNLTLGGCLFFALEPQNFLPFCKITFTLFEGKDIDEVIEKKDLTGKIEEQIKAAESLLNLYLRTKVEIRGFENELKEELPKEALREAVINAIAHRNYQIPSTIRIFIFSDRIEFITPGRLPNGVTLENIKFGVHVERNPLVVSYLAKMGYMTQIGSGIPRMIRLTKEYTGKEPQFEERDEEFIVRIFRS